MSAEALLAKYEVIAESCRSMTPRGGDGYISGGPGGYGLTGSIEREENQDKRSLGAHALGRHRRCVSSGEAFMFSSRVGFNTPIHCERRLRWGEEWLGGVERVFTTMGVADA